jgi:transcriptional regulator with XRE-family HTH domain
VLLGKRLKKLRGKRTQQEIANMLNIARARYSHYENEHVQPDNELLQKMADIYNVSIDYLVGRTDDPNLTMSEEARSFVDKLELTDEEFIKNNTITIDGIPLTEDQIKKFRDYVRYERAGKMGN